MPVAHAECVPCEADKRHAARAFARGFGFALIFAEKQTGVTVNCLSGGATHPVTSGSRGRRDGLADPDHLGDDQGGEG